jgi:hypothetical protein
MGNFWVFLGVFLKKKIEKGGNTEGGNIYILIKYLMRKIIKY